MNMAGAHILGSGAVCLACTRSPLIRQVTTRFPEETIENKAASFWVLVKGTARPVDHMLDEGGTTIVDTGVYPTLAN